MEDDAVDKRAVLLVVMLASFLTPFMSSSVNIALPSIGKEFSMNAVLESWVATSNLLAAAMFLVPFGKIADMYGRKKVFSYGISIYTLSSFLSAVSTSAVMLICFRVLQGIGGAMIFGTGTAILTSVFPVGERGKALGINAGAIYSGLSLGPFLGGLLTQYLGWRSIFLANVPIGLAVIVLVLWRLRGEWAEARGEGFDFVGSIIYSVSLATIIYGLSLLPSISGLWLVQIGVLGLLSFFGWEGRVGTPVFDMDLFRNNRLFLFSNLAALINYSATFAVGFLLSLYLQHIKALGPRDAGLVLVSQPVVMAVFSPFAGRLSDRFEPRIIASIGMALTTASLLLFSLLDEGTGLGFIVANLILLGFGLALFFSPNTNAVMSSVERRFYGVASAILGTMRLTGQMISMGIAMLIFAVFIGRVEITSQCHLSFLRGVRVGFMVFSALCFIGVFSSLARGKV
jgi:EmrB/QacA subfamily drug resistance transporter